MRYFSLALMAPALCACTATGPLFTPAPLPGGKAIVYIYRIKPGDGLSARDAHFYLDDKHAFDLTPDGYSYVVLSPGKHILREEWSWDVVGGKTIEFPLEVKAGETWYYRFVVETGVNGQPGWHWFLRRVPPSIGENEISTKHLQAPD